MPALRDIKCAESKPPTTKHHTHIVGISLWSDSDPAAIAWIALPLSPVLSMFVAFVL